MDKQFFNILKAKEQNDENEENINFVSAVTQEISIYDVFSEFQRRIILCCMLFAVILLPFSDTVYLPAIDTIANDLKTSDTIINLTISMYLLCNGISCLIWGVICDRWGRNLTMRFGLLIFLFSSVFSIFTLNKYLLLILRIFQGCTISVTAVVSQAVIADIYPPDQRGRAVGVIFIPVLVGVILGPVIGGILTYYYGWRSIFVFQSILTFILLIIYILIIPETHQYQVMKQITNKKIIECNEILEPKLSNPFLPLIYLSHSNILAFILSASTAFASIIVNQLLLSITLAKEPYSFNEFQIGLSNIPLGLGEIIGCLMGGYIFDKGDKIFKNKILEYRLIPGTICFILIPIGLVIYGWTFQWTLNATIPITAAFIVALGQALYRPQIYSYLTIKEQQNSATIASVNNFLNFIFAAITLAISLPIIDKINIGPFFTILSIVNIFTIILTILFIIKTIRFTDNNYQTI
jgi:multidrug resistance protein